MTVKVAINGFGRIGRTFFRQAFGDPRLEIVAINITRESRIFAHLLKYDSTFGKYEREVSYDDEHLIVDGQKIRLFSNRDPAALPWGELGIDIVIESTGAFTTAEKAGAHLRAGAKRVVLSAPGKGGGDMPTLVYGVNHEQFDPKRHPIVSNASCTTNALAPTAMVLDQAFGIECGMMSTVHAYTNDQSILDKSHKDLRRARTAGASIIPTTTGAATALSLVLPQLKGKLDGFAMRVPTQDVSIVDLTVQLARPVTKEEVNAAYKAASEGKLRGIMGYSEEPLVSIDYVGDTHSAVLDALSTMVINGNMVKIIAWYDNEYGYSSRLKDLILYMGERS
ncbi:MAG: type I glyceraldehyde-3-phosphate dehydrogenase [Clostridia bacterium]|nr:type I glyceraldehyde-3-phosphate dehydrogenase [Clostridia bacterium]